MLWYHVSMAFYRKSEQLLVVRLFLENSIQIPYSHLLTLLFRGGPTRVEDRLTL